MNTLIIDESPRGSLHQPWKNTTTEVTQDVLGVDGYVVSLYPTFSNTIAGGMFHADFPCSLDDGKQFIIRVRGNIYSMKDNGEILGKHNPLLTKIGEINLKELHPTNIPRDAQFSLFDENGQPIETSHAFWKEFRKRINSRFPLSTIEE